MMDIRPIECSMLLYGTCKLVLGAGDLKYSVERNGSALALPATPIPLVAIRRDDYHG